MYDFKRVEAEILDFWKRDRIFQKSLEARSSSKRFVFFEGPPTANGRPGIHHFLGRAFKDLFCRYKTMQGFFVLRKAGWDTHGLPVELEIEKELGFKNKKDIEEYGIAKFNKKAKESVWKYKKEWEEMTDRMGFWLDMDHPYITYESPYVESVWRIIKKISDKKLLYKAHKVVPFCTRCGTPLSAHEVAQGYKTVKDKSVYVKFKLKPGQKIVGQTIGDRTYILAWTTTPWTLPGNVALAVGKNIDYVITGSGQDVLILASELADKVVLNAIKNRERTEKGSVLIGLEYEPLFEIPELKSETSYKIYDADFVSTVDGTGVVHTAVMYGEDDYELGTKVGLPKFHTVDEAGRFTHVGKDFDGLPVKHKDRPTEDKTTDKIINYLTERGSILKTEEYEHEYPFCWRCDTPLLYYAKTSWFFKVSAVKEKLLKNASKINWYPDNIKEGRFGQWLKEGRDWTLSRERYWGTPLPVWECEKCNNHRVVGSYHELQKHSIGRKNKYLMLRHSLSNRNESSGSITINSDINHNTYHLTEEGKKILQPVAEHLSHENIDVIYTSPFLRTKETAQIIGKTVHKTVNEDDRLSEIRHGGQCEGKGHLTCPLIAGPRNLDTRHDGGESWNDLRLRLMDFMNDMESKYKGKTILIVSHGDPLLLLKYMAEGLNGDQIMQIEEIGNRPYPKIAEALKIDWRTIPRNDSGELDPHRPFIDKMTFKCPKCRAVMKKVPDLIDVWFDSGSMPFAQWHWDFENKAMFKDQFPADFIVEGIDQTRGWFYTLLAIATLLDKKNPYKNVMSLGHVLDEKGKKMSKSKGNVVSPFEVMDKAGSDAARWYFYTLNPPGEYKLFSQRDLEIKLRGFIFTLENCMNFLELYKDQIPDQYQMKHSLDKWVMSRFNNLLLKASAGMDDYDVTSVSREIEKFVIEDLSNWWLRRSRKRTESLPLLGNLMLELSKMMAPFIPFVSEDIYRRLKKPDMPESVHLANWPKADKKSVDLKLEEEMAHARSAVTIGLALRKERSIRVRQPLGSATVKRGQKFKPDIEGMMMEELNVKNIKYDKKQEAMVVLDETISEGLLKEGIANEIKRQIQDMRKEAKYNVNDTAEVLWHSGNKQIEDSVNEFKKMMEQDTSSRMSRLPDDSAKWQPEIEKEIEIIPGGVVKIGVKK